MNNTNKELNTEITEATARLFQENISSDYNQLEFEEAIWECFWVMLPWRTCIYNLKKIIDENNFNWFIKRLDELKHDNTVDFKKIQRYSWNKNKTSEQNKTFLAGLLYDYFWIDHLSAHEIETFWESQHNNVNSLTDNIQTLKEINFEKRDKVENLREEYSTYIWKILENKDCIFRKQDYLKAIINSLWLEESATLERKNVQVLQLVKRDSWKNHEIVWLVVKIKTQDNDEHTRMISLVQEKWNIIDINKIKTISISKGDNLNVSNPRTKIIEPHTIHPKAWIAFAADSKESFNDVFNELVNTRWKQAFKSNKKQLNNNWENELLYLKKAWKEIAKLFSWFLQWTVSASFWTEHTKWEYFEHFLAWSPIMELKGETTITKIEDWLFEAKWQYTFTVDGDNWERIKKQANYSFIIERHYYKNKKWQNEERWSIANLHSFFDEDLVVPISS